ncbi:MAG: hypothetical protein RMJ97_00240 [Raineya sp.]|nr:hypothetical protein [Raineya sp.]MDW8295289.1 hypothetical protein [Raineya sp.]
MEIKYTPAFLSKIEDIFAESNLFLRYEKGNFKSGYCILKEKRIIVVNKYFSLEGKINSLLDILKQVEIDENLLSVKTKRFYEELMQENLNG